MYIPRVHTRRKNGVAWQLFICLALFAFLGRALIPVGYMPESAAERDGLFSVTFCTVGGGPGTMLMDLGGESGSPSDHADVLECPFALVLAQAVLPAADLAVLDGRVSRPSRLIALRNQALPPLPALGPPLGSRAPPSNLG